MAEYNPHPLGSVPHTIKTALSKFDQGNPPPYRHLTVFYVSDGPAEHPTEEKHNATVSMYAVICVVGSNFARIPGRVALLDFCLDRNEVHKAALLNNDAETRLTPNLLRMYNQRVVLKANKGADVVWNCLVSFVGLEHKKYGSDGMTMQHCVDNYFYTMSMILKLEALANSLVPLELRGKVGNGSEEPRPFFFNPSLDVHNEIHRFLYSITHKELAIPLRTIFETKSFTRRPLVGAKEAAIPQYAKELNEDLGGMRQAALFLLDTGSIYGSKHEVVVDIGSGDEALKRMTYRQQAEGKKVFATGKEIPQLRTMWARKSSRGNAEE